jgi:hypothetical protein
MSDFCEVRGFERCEDALLAFRAGEKPEAVLLDIGLPAWTASREFAS